MLRTERLFLRAPLRRDLDAMFAVYSDPRAMRYWSTPPHENPQVTKRLLDGRIAAWERAPLNYQIEMEINTSGMSAIFVMKRLGSCCRQITGVREF